MSALESDHENYVAPIIARCCETIPSHTNDCQSWNVWGREVTVVPASYEDCEDGAEATQWITTTEDDLVYLEEWA